MRYDLVEQYQVEGHQGRWSHVFTNAEQVNDLGMAPRRLNVYSCGHYTLPTPYKAKKDAVMTPLDRRQVWAQAVAAKQHTSKAHPFEFK